MLPGLGSNREPEVESILKESEIECRKYRAVTNHMDLSNFFICKCEAKSAEEMSTGSDHQANSAVDEDGACGSCSLSCLDGLAGPELCAANFGWQRGRGGGCIGADNEIGIEYGDESIEVACPQRCQKRIDHSSLS